MASKVAAIVLAAGVCATSGCASLGSASGESTFFVEGAAAASPHCIDGDYRELAVACHRLVAGELLVVGLRQFTDGAGDGAKFRKVTLFLTEDVREGETLSFPTNRARAVFGSGLSFMPGKSGCYGEAKSGTVTIKRRTQEVLELEIAIQFDLKSPLNWPDACNDGEFAETVIAQRSTMERFGPWEGVRGTEDSVVAESVPANR